MLNWKPRVIYMLVMLIANKCYIFHVIKANFALRISELA